MMFGRCLLLAIGAVGISAVPAHASIISLNYDFSGTNFFLAETPDPITGSFSVTFDNSSNITNQTTGVTLSVNVPVTGTLGFTYVAVSDLLTIGFIQSVPPCTDVTFTCAGDFGGGVIVAADLTLTITNASSLAPVLFELSYGYATFDNMGQVISANIDSAGDTELTPSAVPEPTTLALLGLSAAGMGVRRWRRRS